MGLSRLGNLKNCDMEVKEIRLKQSDGSYIEVEVEYKDGVLFVSPMVEKFEPKEGDVVVSNAGNIAIFSHFDDEGVVFQNVFHNGILSTERMGLL